jgi:hypothetical protein
MPTTAPTPPPPRFAWSPRNTLNVIVVVLAAAAVVAEAYGLHLPLGITSIQVQTAAGAFVIGALVPGSPIGRVLDYIASFFGGPPAPPPSAADVAEIEGELRAPAPMRVPPSSSLTALGVVLVLLLPGCGGAAYRNFAIASTVARMSADGMEAAVGVAQGSCTTDECRAMGAEAKAGAEAIKATAAALDASVRAAQAAQIGEVDAVLSALANAVGRFVTAWNVVAALLTTMGMPVPELPPAVSALIEGTATVIASATAPPTSTHASSSP